MEQSQSRLDVQFPFEAGDQLLGALRDLMRVLEARLANAERQQTGADEQAETLVDVGLARINEVLLPSVLRIQKLTSLGFLIAPSTTSVKLELAQKTFFVTEGEQRDLFTPSAYVSIERTSDYTTRAIAKVLSYDNKLGALTVLLIAVFGAQGPFTDWTISSSPGVTESTRVNMEAAGASAAAALAARQQADQDATATAADRLAAAGSKAAAAASEAQALAYKNAIDPVALLAQANEDAIALVLALS